MAVLEKANRLSLVIPAYQEALGIAHAIEEAEQELALLGLADFEILVVDDGSSDATFEIAVTTANKFSHTRVVRHGQNLGYGRALRTGFENARFELVAFTDADAQFFLSDLRPLIEETGVADLAVGYRFDRQDPKFRKFLSKGYNLLAHSLLNTQVRDCDCALKVFRKEALAKILPETHGFFVNTEMFHKAGVLGLEVREIPVRHRSRHAGSSKVGLFEVPKTLRALLPYWWSRKFCSGKETSGISSQKPNSLWTYYLGILLLIIATSILFGTRLRAPLLEPQEARYAEIPREMLLKSEWVVPLLHDGPYLDKPPLTYWAVMCAYKIFGVHDWVARLVPCLAGVGTVLLLAYWGWASGYRWQGLFAGFILCLSNRFIYLGRMLSPDALLSFFVTSGLVFSFLAFRGKKVHHGYLFLGSLSVGLGFLAKGPVAIMLVGLPLIAWLFLDTSAGTLRWKSALFALAVSVGVTLPWQIAISVREPDFLSYFYFGQNFSRFWAPYDHQEPIWFFLPQLLIGMFPWIFLFPGLIRDGMKPASQGAALGPLGGFALLATTFSLAFFSLSLCKRPIYLLPVLPSLAMVFGFRAVSFFNKLPNGVWSGLWMAKSRLGYTWIGSLFLIAGSIAITAKIRGLLNDERVLWFALFTFSAGVVVLAAGLSTKKLRVSWGIAGVFTFLFLWLGVRELLPAYNNAFSLRGHLRQHLRQGEGKPEVVVCYPHKWDSIPFYLPGAKIVTFGREDKESLIGFLRERKNTLVLVRTGREKKELEGMLPNQMEFLADRNPGSITVGWVRIKASSPLGGIFPIQ